MYVNACANANGFAHMMMMWKFRIDSDLGNKHIIHAWRLSNVQTHITER